MKICQYKKYKLNKRKRLVSLIMEQDEKGKNEQAENKSIYIMAPDTTRVFHDTTLLT